MEREEALTLAGALADISLQLRLHANHVSQVGWHVSGQQLENAARLVNDVTKRLENGDDLRGAR